MIRYLDPDGLRRIPTITATLKKDGELWAVIKGDGVVGLFRTREEAVRAWGDYIENLDEHEEGISA